MLIYKDDPAYVGIQKIHVYDPKKRDLDPNYKPKIIGEVLEGW